MALKDCIKKFSKTLDKGDRELLQSYLDQGLTDEQAVSRLELVLSKQLLDISLRAKKAGAAVRVKTDVLGEVRSYGAARLKVLRSELANIRNEQDLLSAQREEITWVESNIKHWEAGGQRIDLSNDTELYMRFEQMKFIHKDAFRRGEFGDGQIKGKDTYELVQSFRAMQERGANILSEIHGLLLREAAILEEMESLQGGREGVLDESGNYVIAPTPPKPAKEINVTYTTKLPWKISSSGEGDLYISRHGTKAGTPHKERQGPNDFAIKLDESLLDTNFTYYLLTYLQPKIAARAHGTAQQAIKKGDIEEVLIEHFKSQAREDSGTFYTNSGATTEQKVEEAKANYKAIVKVVEERTIKTGVTKVNNAADAAHVLAEIRKNASEGMWAAVLDAKNNVVGIVEHSRGTIDGTSVYPSTFAGAILTIPGAAKVWFAHNHPSGTLEASQADERITARMKNLMTGSGVEIQGHVIVGGGQANYTLMDPGGNVIERSRPITAKARNKSVKVFTRKIRGKQLGEHVTSPADTERVLSDMGHPNGVLLLNNRHRVLGFVSMTADEMRVLKDTGGSNRLLKAFSEMNAAAFIVSTDRPEMDAANNMASFAKAGDVRMLDAIYKDQSGAVKSMAQQGTISAANTFYQSTIGFTSGLLTAVQTMSREKGTVAEMLGSLRKTTKIKKGKKKGELVTTYAPGVTKEEMNWLDFEEWAEARAAEPDAPLPSKRLQIRTPDRTTEVLQNPTLAQIALFKQSIRMEYEELGYSTTEDPMTRSTWDENGNRFLWASAEAVHIVMEEDLARHLGVNPATLSQHNEGKKPKASGTITRQQMIDYVSANGIVVEEVQHKDQQAYPGQSLEGGKAPRDIVLKMPEIPEDSLIHSFHIVKDGVGDSFITDDIADDLFTWFQTDERMVGIDASREGQGRRVKFIVENVTETQYDLIINYMNQTGLTLIDEQTTDFRAVDERQRQLIEKSPGLKENFPFSHFSYKNILAWIRTTERTGPNGERILMVEEIQSDWHQRGAKEERGYATPEKLEEIGASQVRIDELQAEKMALIKSMKDEGVDTDAIGEDYVTTVDALKAEKANHKKLLAARLKMVPDAPFKGRGWPRLAMKRIIRLAAEEGFDQVSIITGDHANERNHVAYYVDSVKYDLNSETMTIDRKDGREQNISVPQEELSEWIGDDAADLLNAKINETIAWYEFVWDPENQMMDVIDGNGEPFYTAAGESIGANNYDDAKQMLWDELSYTNRLPELTSDELNGLMVGSGQERFRNFYDNEVVNLTNEAAKKLDKKARVQRFGQEIYLDEQAPYTHDLRRRTIGDRRLPSGSSLGWYVVDYQGRTAAGPFEQESMAIGVANQRNNRRTKVHTISITDQMREAALEGQTLFQKKKGSISFDATRKGIIKLTKSRDLSTFLHEAGHLYLEIMGSLAEQKGAPKQITDDYKKILEYLGVKNRAEITREHHELWAESFEKYLHEGKAPSVQLQSAFNAFRRWLTDIWNRMKGASPDGLILTPEIRDVMDRILASDEQIAQAKVQQEFSAVFSTAEQMGVSQEVFDAYKESILKENNDAIERETKRLMAAANRDKMTWWKEERAKVRAQVEAEAHNRRVYQATALLSNGTKPDGSPLDQGSPFKLDKASLVDKFGKDFLKRLPKPWVYTLKGGVDVDVAARQLGYQDGTALVEALVKAPAMKDWIEYNTDQIMQKQFPDPMLDGSIADEAIKAVHNERRANIIAAEMRRFRQLQKRDRKIVSATKKEAKRTDVEARLANQASLPKRAEIALIKVAAAAKVGAMRLMDVSPQNYLAAERKAGRQAFEAAARSDYQKAYVYKRAQLVNHEMYRAAQRAKENSEKTHNYLTKFSNPRVQQRLGKLNALDPILAILEGIELRKVTLKELNRRAALQDLAQQIHDGGIITPISEFLYHVEVSKNGKEIVVLNEAPFKNWKELTVDELEALKDIIKQLEFQADKTLRMPVNGEMIVLEDATTELRQNILEANKIIDIGIGEKTRKQRRGKAAKSGLSHWLSPSVMARILDAQDWGAFSRLVVVTIRRAIVDRLVPMQQKAITDVSTLYRDHFTNAELRRFPKKGFAKIGNETLSKSDVLSIALNMGNEGNRQALFNGIKVNGQLAYPEAEVNDVLGKLTERDWLFVQAVWDYLDSYWPAIAKMEKERRGIAPERVEPTAFVVETADGKQLTLKGGYYPLKYNYEHSARGEAAVFEDHYAQMGNGTYVSASTRAGATHNRVKNHKMVVQLGLHVIDRHLKEITRDMAIGNEVNFVQNLLNDSGVRNAMQNTSNNEALRELKLWLADTAVGELPANNEIERWMAWARVGFTKSKLAFNVYTAALQLTGYAQSVATIGAEAMAYGAGMMLKDPVGSWKKAFAASQFLRVRYDKKHLAFDKDVTDAAGILKEYGGGLPTMENRAWQEFGRWMFYPIAKMQQLVDVTTWYGGFWKARNKLDLDDHDAVLYADAQVELAQTSGFFSDRSGVERGTLSPTTRQSQFVRLWTTLISYMARKGNLAYMKTNELKREMSFKNAIFYATDMILLFTVEGMASAWLYGRVDWDDDPDELLLQAFKETAASMAAGIPFVREIPGSAYGSGNTPIGGLSKDLFTLYIQAGQGEMDPALRKAFINSFGTIFHLPASQTNRLLEALIDEDDPEILEYLTGTRD